MAEVRNKFNEQGCAYAQARFCLPAEYDGLSFAQMARADAKRELFERFWRGCSRIKKNARDALDDCRTSDRIIYVRDLDLYGLCNNDEFARLEHYIYGTVNFGGVSVPSPYTNMHLYWVHRADDWCQLVVRSCGPMRLHSVDAIAREKMQLDESGTIIRTEDESELTLGTRLFTYADGRKFYDQLLAHVTRVDLEAAQTMREALLIDAGPGYEHWMSLLDISAEAISSQPDDCESAPEAHAACSASTAAPNKEPCDEQSIKIAKAWIEEVAPLKDTLCDRYHDMYTDYMHAHHYGMKRVDRATFDDLVIAAGYEIVIKYDDVAYWSKLEEGAGMIYCAAKAEFAELYRIGRIFGEDMSWDDHADAINPDGEYQFIRYKIVGDCNGAYQKLMRAFERSGVRQIQPGLFRAHHSMMSRALREVL